MSSSSSVEFLSFAYLIVWVISPHAFRSVQTAFAALLGVCLASLLHPKWKIWNLDTDIYIQLYILAFYQEPFGCSSTDTFMVVSGIFDHDRIK